MADHGILTLAIASDQAPYWDVTTTPGGSTYQDMTGWAMQFVIRRAQPNGRPDQTAAGLVISKSTGGGGITIGNGLGTGSRATVTITDADITKWPPGDKYLGALWRTDDGNDLTVWDGPVTLLEAAAQG